jgi:hypothetical protein
MTTSLPNQGPSARPLSADNIAVDNIAVDSTDEARLRGLSPQQLHDRLAWLSWYKPGIFTAVMDYMEFSDALAADSVPFAAGPPLAEI